MSGRMDRRRQATKFSSRPSTDAASSKPTRSEAPDCRVAGAAWTRGFDGARSAADDGAMNSRHISVDHTIMGGVPCVAGTRIPVATVVGLVANGLSVEEIRTDYPQLTAEDVQACLVYAAHAVDERELPVRFSA
jgi:uncharacterized protein (DUF433 family)